jgi:hypothetical protein
VSQTPWIQNIATEAYLVVTNHSIVAIHGLRGHAANTWTHAGREPVPHLWIRDFIPKKLPGARVMTFGYDASLLSGSMVGIEEAAKQLLDGLALIRPSNTFVRSPGTLTPTTSESKKLTWNSSQLAQRPIIFLAHSLGGLVVKAVWRTSGPDAHFDLMLNTPLGPASIQIESRAIWGCTQQNMQYCILWNPT